MVITGLENLLKSPELIKAKGRLGVLYNQASVDGCFISTPELIWGMFPDRLEVLFGPQHGVWCTEQDNMIETDHAVHPKLGLPLYSLYAEARRPSAKMLQNVDTVIVDLQDVGTRVYTFAATGLYMLEACAAAGKEVVVLDRPNPIGGIAVEGNVLNPDYASFVGPHPIPMRHGFTLGELLSFYNEEFDIHCKLDVITMTNWKRSQYYDDTDLAWVFPSPNMPTVETAVVYPGQVILEGTNISEGRGTTKPFELFGAPYFDTDLILATIDKTALRGAILQPTAFKPTFNKWADRVCFGFLIHVTDRNAFKPYRFSLAVLSSILQAHPNDFRWTDPPYEYVEDKLPIDVILGDAQIRLAVESGKPLREMENEWTEKLTEFNKRRAEYLIY